MLTKLAQLQTDSSNERSPLPYLAAGGLGVGAIGGTVGGLKGNQLGKRYGEEQGIPLVNEFMKKQMDDFSSNNPELADIKLLIKLKEEEKQKLLSKRIYPINSEIFETQKAYDDYAGRIRERYADFYDGPTQKLTGWKWDIHFGLHHPEMNMNWDILNNLSEKLNVLRKQKEPFLKTLDKINYEDLVDLEKDRDDLFHNYRRAQHETAKQMHDDFVSNAARKQRNIGIGIGAGAGSLAGLAGAYGLYKLRNQPE
jgi:hypothetical protein